MNGLRPCPVCTRPLGLDEDVPDLVPRSVAETFAAALEDALVGELDRAPLAALDAYRAVYPREETP